MENILFCHLPAYQDLSKMNHNRIIVIGFGEVSDGNCAQLQITRDLVKVTLNRDCDERFFDNVATHELLHYRVRLEGYPYYCINKRKMRNREYEGRKITDNPEVYLPYLNNAIQHPLIFNFRITKYCFKNDREYWILHTEKILTIIKTNLEKGTINDRLLSIIQGLDYFYIPSNVQEIFDDRFRELNPEIYSICESLYKEELHYNSPIRAKQSARFLLSYLENIGRKWGLPENANVWAVYDYAQMVR